MIIPEKAEKQEVKVCYHCGKTNLDELYPKNGFNNTSTFFLANNKAVCQRCMIKYHGLHKYWAKSERFIYMCAYKTITREKLPGDDEIWNTDNVNNTEKQNRSDG